ncbi:SGNH/GDSL hydrolase family protein [Leptospira sp. WS92.C1]
MKPIFYFKIIFFLITFILLVEVFLRIFPPVGLIYRLKDKQVHCMEEKEIPEIMLCPNSDTILQHPAGFTFRVRVDEFAERIVSEKKPFAGSKPEIWLMGDSIAYGFGLNDEDTIAWKLQKELSPAGLRVRNLGVDSLGTGGVHRKMERTLICKDPIFKKDCILPKAVFWIYHPSDLQDVQREFYLRNSLSGRWFFRGSVLLSRYSAIYNYFKIRSENKRFETLRTQGPAVIPETLSNTPDDHPSFQELRKFFYACKKMNIPLTIVLYPNGTHSLTTPLSFTPLLDQIIAIAKKEGIAVLDIRSDFIKQYDLEKTDFYLPNDGHPTSAAAELIAKKILERIR